ncbi:MAG TPA: hypothetical protein DCE42_14020 [Myxococcales bacterium]|nr:hypothetical protein [Deltaproteobacteria bacterium]HAA55875.1 hypothetical protein [Myxococcales bacterium]
MRQNVKTGEVVQIHTCFQQCFVDVCVPEGEYKYGYKEPYTCPPDTEPMPPFQVKYYRTVFTKKWSDEELKTCLRKSNAKLPTPYEGEVPWRDHHVRNCGL